MSVESEPTPPSERIVSLDALRGFALLGILLINVFLFSMPEAVLLNPTVYGDFTGVNYHAWLITHIFAELKFMTLFTMLFGAGIVLFFEGKDADERTVTRLHFRRNVWLVLFGLAHAYLLWYGDILVGYGLCAFIVVVLRDWRPTEQFLAGVAILLTISAANLVAGLTLGGEAVVEAWRPAERTLQMEVETYRGGWLEQMHHRVSTAFESHTVEFLGYTIFRVSGLMLLGMALFRWGVLSNRRSNRFYRRMIAYGTVGGLALILLGVLYIERHDWAAGAALIYRQFNYVGSVLLAGAYIGAVMLYCRARPDGIVVESLAAVGRTAFSNYILQTLIATSIFYGHGLGLFGHLSRVELLGVVLVIWAVQIPLSVFWVNRFRYGPLEWLWRTLTYGRIQPMTPDE